MKLGYYNHGEFIKDNNGKLYVPFDIAIWADRFGTLCEKFVLFLNNKNQKTYRSDAIPKSFYPLNPKVPVTDIGQQRPHWQKALGLGLNKQAIKEATKELDFIIIQGPTPQQNAVAKSVHPNCKIASLLVGIWIKWPPEMFRRSGFSHTFREIFINNLKKYNQYQTRVFLNKYCDVVMGNNPEMPIFYKAKKPFKLVSKGLIKENEITAYQPAATPKDDIIKLIFFSRLGPEKNVEMLIRAVSRLKNMGRQAELKVYGGAAFPEYLEFLQNLAKKLQVQENIHFMGEIPNHKKLEIFSSSDIYIFNTCTTEGFPRTVWEAIAAAIPTTCANYLGADKFFTNGEVLLFQKNDINGLVKNIVALKDDAALRETTANKATDLLRQNTMEASTQNIYSILEKEING